MASDLEYVRHVCDQLEGVGGVSYKKMFGEYAIYVGPKVVALVCDNQLFLKPTRVGRELLGQPREGPPYPGAKPYLMIDEYLDDRTLLCEVVRATDAALPIARARKRRS